MSELAIEVTGLGFRHASAAEPTLHEVDLRLERGQVLLVLGATGSGKSTLFQCLNGLIPHVLPGELTGTVRVAGRDVAEHSVAQLSRYVGTVLQDPELQLFSLSVRDELAFGPENLALPRPEIAQRVADAARTMAVTALLDREPATLSGGQQQAVVLAAVSTMLPEVLVLDEPTSNLDPASTERVLDLIGRLNREAGRTVVIAEHDIDAVAGLADQVAVLAGGRLVAAGPARQVLGDVAMLRAHGLRPPVATQAYLDVCGAGAGPVPLTIGECTEAVRRWRCG